MKIALSGLGVIAAILAAVVAVGFMLPVKHRSSRQALYHQPATKIFALITNVKEFPAWRGSVKTVEILPPGAGRPRFREIGSDGSILYEMESVVPPRQLIKRIADRSLPFGGRWTYDLTPDSDSTILRITEDGEVYNPLFRFVSRFIIGHTRTMDRYLRDVAKHFGEESTLVIESR